MNGAKERTWSSADIKINSGLKLVVVDFTTRLFGNVQPLADKEMELVDSSGNSFGDYYGLGGPVTRADNGSTYSPERRRGQEVFLGPRDAKGLKLVFRPTGDAKVEFDLGTLAQIPPPAGAASTGPKLVDQSVLPAELKVLPLPSGFGIVDGSTRRTASGGKFQSADAQLFGKTEIEEVAAFYKAQLAREWETLDEYIAPGEMQLMFMNRKDDDQNLYVTAEQTDEGTTVDIRMERGS